MTTLDRLKIIIEQSVDNYDKDAVQPDNNLVNDVGLDSLDMIAVATGIEKHYGINMSETTLEEFDNIQQLIDHIHEAVR